MFGRRVTLFRIFGFEVRLDASWILMAGLIVWSLANGLFPSQYPGLPVSTYWWMGLAGGLGLFASIIIHELCHSLVAHRYHLPMGGITLFIFGGVAEMRGEPGSPKIEFLMAIAGPVASVVLSGFFYAVRHAAPGAWPVPVDGITGYLAWINLALAGFNMMPAFPLDGGRILRSTLWKWTGDIEKATRFSSRLGEAFGVLLMIFGGYQLLKGHLIAAIWYVLIGLFLQRASRISYEEMLLHSAAAEEAPSVLPAEQEPE